MTDPLDEYVMQVRGPGCRVRVGRAPALLGLGFSTRRAARQAAAAAPARRPCHPRLAPARRRLWDDRPEGPQWSVGRPPTPRPAAVPPPYRRMCTSTRTRSLPTCPRMTSSWETRMRGRRRRTRSSRWGRHVVWCVWWWEGVGMGVVVAGGAVLVGGYGGGECGGGGCGGGRGWRGCDGLEGMTSQPQLSAACPCPITHSHARCLALSHTRVYCLSVPQEEFKDLAKWWKESLGPAVESVKVSKRLATTPCVVVSSKVRRGAAAAAAGGGCCGWARVELLLLLGLLPPGCCSGGARSPACLPLPEVAAAETPPSVSRPSLTTPYCPYRPRTAPVPPAVRLVCHHGEDCALPDAGRHRAGQVDARAADAGDQPAPPADPGAQGAGAARWVEGGRGSERRVVVVVVVVCVRLQPGVVGAWVAVRLRAGESCRGAAGASRGSRGAASVRPRARAGVPAGGTRSARSPAAVPCATPAHPPLLYPLPLPPQHIADPESASVKDNAQLLYQTCLLESGARPCHAGGAASSCCPAPNPNPSPALPRPPTLTLPSLAPAFAPPVRTHPLLTLSPPALR